MLWLCSAVSGVRITWPRLLIIGGSAVVAVGLISVLDWARGPDRRSHLGNFMQRIIDGDALDVVSRKASRRTTLTGPLGIGALVIGIALLGRDLPLRLPWSGKGQFSTIDPVLIALLGPQFSAPWSTMADRRVAYGDRLHHRNDRLVLRGLRSAPGLDDRPISGPPVALRPWRTQSRTPAPGRGVAQPWAELGLKGDEYAKIIEILGRRPTSSELAMYSVMWSEHCSYKSSKVHLRRFSELSPDDRQAARRHRGERRRDRRRPGLRRDVQDRIAQPSQLRGAYQGPPPVSAASSGTSWRWGRGRSGDGSLAFGPLHGRTPPGCCLGSSPVSAATGTVSAYRTSAVRWSSTGPISATRWSTRLCRRTAARRSSSGQGHRGQPGDLVRSVDRWRRDRRV